MITKTKQVSPSYLISRATLITRKRDICANHIPNDIYRVQLTPEALRIPRRYLPDWIMSHLPDGYLLFRVERKSFLFIDGHRAKPLGNDFGAGVDI